jgi:pimeloyl-ACP methyl ester carboxylesterase
MFPFRLANLFSRRVSHAPNISYWYKPHTSKTRLPILFIHGIGIGLYPYAQFLADINKDDALGPDDGEIGIIAIEIMPISFRITNPILPTEELCRQITTILAAHGWDRVVLASHSYGSVLASHLLDKLKFGPMLFIDPVTFLLHLPDVCYNFTARSPRGANEHQLHYFACTDMMVSHTLARNFFWADYILWREDLRKRNLTVSLGGRDLIVDTDAVGKYLSGIDLASEDSSWKEKDWTGLGLETVYFPTCDHAQVFESREGRKRLGDILRSYASAKKYGPVTVDEEPYV